MSEEEKKTGENPQPVPDEEVSVGDVSASEPEDMPEEAPEDVTEEAAEETPSEAEEAESEPSEEEPEDPSEDVTHEAAPEPAPDDVEDEPAEEDDKKRKVIIGVSVVAAIIVVFIIVLLCLIGSCTHRHTMSYVEEVASTCTEAGTVAHWHCDECGKDYADEAGEEELSDLALPLAAHTLTHVEEVASTCVVAGTAEYWHCSVCDKNFADEEGSEELHDLTLPLAAHTFVEDKYVAPTCTETGLSAGLHCSVCNEVFAEQQVIPALGHSAPEAGYSITAEPTCTEAGSMTYECTRCHEELEATVAALGHKEVQREGKAPTCTETGYTGEVVCERCGEIVKEREVLPALGHTPERQPSVEPTCTEDGYYGEVICTRCNTVLEQRKTRPRLGHQIPEEGPTIIVEPTCTQTGRESYVCVRCNTTIEQDVAALGHDYVLEGNYDATCTEAGLEGRTVCSRCDDVQNEGTVIAPYGHTVSNNVCVVCNTPASTGLLFALGSDGASYTLIGLGTCTDTDILIPDSYTDEASGLGALPVTGIANMAFYGASSVVSISIPYTVTSVGTNAFMNCTSLETVKFGAAVTTIGSTAFMGCESLTSVRFESTPEGWSVARAAGEAGTSVDSEQLGDPMQAAVLFKETYLQYDWTKNPAVVG